MRVFTTTELSRMQGTQESAMMDTCVLLIRAETDAQDEYGMPVAHWIERSSVCGLDDHASREMLNAEAHQYDARLRLPIDTQIDQVDRVRITHRFGVQLSEAVEYEAIGEAMRGPSGLVLNLRSPA